MSENTDAHPDCTLHFATTITNPTHRRITTTRPAAETATAGTSLTMLGMKNAHRTPRPSTDRNPRWYFMSSALAVVVNSPFTRQS